MKDSLDLSISKVLIVCLSSDWGSLERRTLLDAKFVKSNKGKVIIYCLKGSALDFKAKEEHIPTIYYQGYRLNKIIDFKYYRELRRILKEHRFNFIHCFSLSCVWMLSLALRKERAVPLFLTINKVEAKNPRGLIYKWLLSRVDRVFTFSQTMIDIVPSFLEIPKRKVKFSGLGIGAQLIPSIDIEDKKDKELLFITIVGEKDLEQLETYLFQLTYIIDKKKHKLIIYYDSSIESSEKLDKVKNIIISMQVGEFVGLRSFTREQEIFTPNRLLINISNQEPICDYEVRALMSGCLVMGPRSLPRSNLSRIFFGAMKTFQYGNFHDFKNSLNLMVKGHKELSAGLLQQSKEAEFYHGEQNYFELLIKNFIKINKLRYRYFKSKKASNFK